jgi:septal ring factor EnvC (AmiA/AmiB activator)
MLKYSNSPKIEIFLILLFLLIPTALLHSQSVSELKQNIESHNDKIKKLEEEIKAYEKQIETVGNEAKSLQSAIQILDINQKKIGTEIKKTQTNIEKTNLVIQNLKDEIGDTETKISSNLDVISKALNDINRYDDESIIESILANKSLADFLDEYESIDQFQQKVRAQSKELAVHKVELSDKKTNTEKEKAKLVSLKTELSDQNQILASNKKEKNDLLSVTKNKEATYKQILSDRQAQKEKFERELFDFQPLNFLAKPLNEAKVRECIAMAYGKWTVRKHKFYYRK